MRFRAIVFSLTVTATVINCGCGSDSTYNVPADPSKEAAQLGPPTTVSVKGRKVTKPPGGTAPKDLKNTRAVE